MRVKLAGPRIAAPLAARLKALARKYDTSMNAIIEASIRTFDSADVATQERNLAGIARYMRSDEAA
jgi:predicted transcriptional regulator